MGVRRGAPLHLRGDDLMASGSKRGVQCVGASEGKQTGGVQAGGSQRGGASRGGATGGGVARGGSSFMKMKKNVWGQSGSERGEGKLMGGCAGYSAQVEGVGTGARNEYFC